MATKLNLTSNLHNTTASSLGITEETIKNLVHNFYSKLRIDQFIGPIFNEVIQENWDEHLARMCNFWSSVMLSTGKYKGNPLLKHANISQINNEHFIHWLALFEESAYSTCKQEAAAAFFIDRAKKIAQSLMMGIDFYRQKVNL